MIGGNHNPNASLLPDNPSAVIQPVQGGGGKAFTDEIPTVSNMSWKSIPVQIEDNYNNTSFEVTNLETFDDYTERWNNIMYLNHYSLAQKGHANIIVGILNITKVNVFVVAPLHGNKKTALNVFNWVNDVLNDYSDVYIIFAGPLFKKGEQDNEIKKGLESLILLHGSKVLYISDDDEEIPHFNGVLLHAGDHDKQVSIGFIPKHSDVIKRYSMGFNNLTVENLVINEDLTGEETKDIFNISFTKPGQIKKRETEFDEVNLNRNYSFKTSPGWVTEIVFSNNSEKNIMIGGGKEEDFATSAAITAAVAIGTAGMLDTSGNTRIHSDADTSDPELVRVTVNGKNYKIRKITDDNKKSWENKNFNEGENELLEDLGFLISGKVLSLILSVYSGKKCTTETETSLSSECGIIRYIMALREDAERKYRLISSISLNKSGSSEGKGQTQALVRGTGTGITAAPGAQAQAQAKAPARTVTEPVAQAPAPTGVSATTVTATPAAQPQAAPAPAPAPAPAAPTTGTPATTTGTPATTTGTPAAAPLAEQQQKQQKTVRWPNGETEGPIKNQKI
jgi:hypothetical protein